MGNIRNAWCWGQLTNEELLHLEGLKVDRRNGMISAHEYLWGKSDQLIPMKPSIMIPIVILALMLIGIGIVGFVFGR